jgi:hypothetical protein
MNKSTMRTKIKYLVFLIVLLSFFSEVYSFDVYFENNNVTVGKEAILVINASDYSGKARGVINFGNFIIKWDCVYLNHRILKYKIIPSKTEGTVFFEFENGKIFSKTFKIKDNKNFTPTTTYIYYVEENNCVFKPQNSINYNNNNYKNQINKNNNSYILKTENKESSNEKFSYFLFFVLFLLILLIVVALYFYKLGKEESKIEEKLTNLKIPKLKKELLEIKKEEDWKKKAFLLHKLISSDNYLKNKIGENKLQSLYYISFKREINENDQKLIEEILKKIEGE